MSNRGAYPGTTVAVYTDLTRHKGGFPPALVATAGRLIIRLCRNPRKGTACD